MASIWKDIFKDKKKDDDLINLKEDLEKNYNLLKENMIYGQELHSIGSWTYDILKDEVFSSEEIYRVFECSPEKIDGKIENFYLYVHPDDQEEVKRTNQEALKGKEYNIEFRIITSGGREKYVHEKVKILLDEEKNPIKIVGTMQDVTKSKYIEKDLKETGENFNQAQKVAGVGSYKHDAIKDENLTFMRGTIQDITEKKEIEKKLEQEKRTNEMQQKRFEFLIQDSNDCFGIISPDGIILYSSSAVKKVCGYTSEEIEGKNIFKYFEGKEKIKFLEMMELVLKDPDGHIQGEIIGKTKFGKTVYIEITLGNHISEPAVQGIVVNWRDITEKKEKEKETEYIVNHDGLTRLPNRDYFKKQIRLQCEEAKEKEKSFAMMMIDIDRFKYINDALGYRIGDKLIIEIAHRLKSFLGENKFISRYMGDKFAILVSELSTIEEYENLSKKIMGLFSTPFLVDEYELTVGMSMGVSIFPDDGQDTDSLKTHANSALHWAKVKGKNSCAFYSPKMNIQNYKQFVLRNDLPKAIEEGQLKVYYQPEVNIKTNEIIGAEALIRWDHPTWGMISPIEFISIAEETGFIIDIANWMLKEICATYKKWLKVGLPNIKISINYSSIHFLERRFVENIKSVIDEFQLDPHFLIIEITESALIQEKEQITTNIQSLQALGIQVALDDFGTGYSSLQYLNSLNIDILKIDSSFIKNAIIDRSSDIITRTVINMTEELGIKLVAEGIETMDQLAYLQKLNCLIGQGYLYSKPISIEEFEKILSRKKLKPIIVKESVIKEMRRFFRVNFTNLLEGDMTIIEIDDKRVDLGYTKVLIKDMGPGGLSFISNIRLPIKNNIKSDMILKFITELQGKEINVYGRLVWKEEMVGDLFEYGIEFNFDENERTVLTGVLNQFQIKKRNNIGFNDGRFISDTTVQYFKRVFSHD